jgi:hypothetical protein
LLLIVALSGWEDPPIVGSKRKPADTPAQNSQFCFYFSVFIFSLFFKRNLSQNHFLPRWPVVAHHSHAS